MTNSAHFSQITDELLSAYLDQAVTAEERRLVETAVAADPTIAWRLDTLRQTVQLLRALPPVALPRSFILSEDQLNPMPKPVAARTIRALPAPVPPAPAPTGWQAVQGWWRSFWQVGSPVLRNAMAASFALLLVLLVGDNFLSTRLPDLPQTGAVQSPTVTALALPTLVPTTVALVPREAAPAAQPTEPVAQASQPEPQRATTSAVERVETTTVQEGAPGAAQATAPTNPASEQAQAVTMGDRPPGEDQGVALAPESGESTVAAAGMGGSAESATAPRMAGDTAAAKQNNLTETTAVTSAAYSSPLAVPGDAAAQAAASVPLPVTNTAAITASTSVTTATTSAADEAVAAATATPSTLAVATAVFTDSAETEYDPSAVALALATPASPLVVPANQPLAAPAAPSDRIRLLQVISALVTLVLAGLWWRSR